MKIFKILALIAVLLTILSLTVYGQPSLPDAPSQAPIDGGLGLLVAACGAYAYKKLRKNKENIE